VNVSWVLGQSDGIFLEKEIDNDTEWSEGEEFVKSPAGDR